MLMHLSRVKVSVSFNGPKVYILGLYTVRGMMYAYMYIFYVVYGTYNI